MQTSLPAEETMYNALLRKDSSFEGIFVVGVKTTGIFCRPTCSARKPKRENVEFFRSSREALLQGYRACKVCNPLAYHGESPGWLKPLLREIETSPEVRLTDGELRRRGFEPHRIRRWFQKEHGLTFHGYLRTLRMSKAFGRIREGEQVTHATFDAGYDSLSGFAETFKKATGLTPRESRHTNLVTVTRVLTPLGPMLAGATTDGICLLEFVDRRMLETQLQRLSRRLNAQILPGTNSHFAALQTQLSEYFDGKREAFDLPLVISGTEFQEMVWAELRTIPFGETRSYQEQATQIGKPRAVRAVARANGDNRIAILIPCHRVIGSNGKPVGYGGGVWRKRYLLNLERDGG